MTEAEEARHRHTFKMEAAAILDKGDRLRLGFGEGEMPDREGIFDDLEKTIQSENASEDVLMTGIWLLIIAFDGSDRRCRRLSHAYLNAMQDKGVFYPRILSLLWLLYNAGDRDYAAAYRFGRYEAGYDNYNFPNVISDRDDKSNEKAVCLLEEIAYGSLPKECMLLIVPWNHIMYSNRLSVDLTVLNRLEAKCADNREWLRLVKEIGYWSGSSSMENLLTLFKPGDEDDSWRMYQLIKSNVFEKKTAGEKREELMSLIKWSKDSKDQFLYNECIGELQRTY